MYFKTSQGFLKNISWVKIIVNTEHDKTAEIHFCVCECENKLFKLFTDHVFKYTASKQSPVSFHYFCHAFGDCRSLILVKSNHHKTQHLEVCDAIVCHLPRHDVA